jgi:hypothetical protein
MRLWATPNRGALFFMVFSRSPRGPPYLYDTSRGTSQSFQRRQEKPDMRDGQFLVRVALIQNGAHVDRWKSRRVRPTHCVTELPGLCIQSKSPRRDVISDLRGVGNKYETLIMSNRCRACASGQSNQPKGGEDYALSSHLGFLSNNSVFLPLDYTR